MPVFEEAHVLAKNYGTAVTNFLGISSEISTFMQRVYGINSPMPTFQSAGLDVARLPFEEAFQEYLRRYDAAIHGLCRQFENNRVGRVEWFDDTARYSFIEAQEQTHLMRWERIRTKETHEIVKAVAHPLSEPGVPMDERTRFLVSIFCPSLKPFAQIITGLEIQKHREHAGRDEGLTKFGEFVHGTRQTADSATQSARTALSKIDPATAGLVAGGVALAGLGVTALSWLGTVATTAAMAVAVADPAIAIGEYCLHGWD